MWVHRGGGTSCRVVSSLIISEKDLAGRGEISLLGGQENEAFVTEYDRCNLDTIRRATVTLIRDGVWSAAAVF